MRNRREGKGREGRASGFAPPPREKFPSYAIGILTDRQTSSQTNRDKNNLLLSAEINILNTS